MEQEINHTKLDEMKQDYARLRPYFLRLERQYQEDEQFKRQCEIQKYNPYEDPDMDEGMAEPVAILMKYGLYTYESCRGGEGHLYDHPTIRFTGGFTEGMLAYHALASHQYDVFSISYIWSVMGDDGLSGPNWEVRLDFGD